MSDPFFVCVFPFLGMGWASIGGGEGEAELRGTEGRGVRCGRLQRELRPLFTVFLPTILTFYSVRLSRRDGEIA